MDFLFYGDIALAEGLGLVDVFDADLFADEWRGAVGDRPGGGGAGGGGGGAVVGHPPVGRLETGGRAGAGPGGTCWGDRRMHNGNDTSGAGS